MTHVYTHVFFTHMPIQDVRDKATEASEKISAYLVERSMNKGVYDICLCTCVRACLYTWHKHVGTKQCWKKKAQKPARSALHEGSPRISLYADFVKKKQV